MNLQTLSVNFAQSSALANIQMANGQTTSVEFKAPEALKGTVQDLILEALLMGTTTQASPKQLALSLQKEADNVHTTITNPEAYAHLESAPVLNISATTGLPFKKHDSKQRTVRNAIVKLLLNVKNAKRHEGLFTTRVAELTDTTPGSVRTQLHICKHLGITARDKDGRWFLTENFINGGV